VTSGLRCADTVTDAAILIYDTYWMGQISNVAQRVLQRLAAFLSDTDNSPAARFCSEK
jgi:hypothetical protein